jgi:hypothetical protein
MGPNDLPNGRVEVEMIRPHDMPGFFLCVDRRGQRLVIHGQKLTPADSAQKSNPDRTTAAVPSA